jgi:hypothetical protein
MTVEPTAPRGYQITVAEAERDQLIAGLELAIATKRQEPERWRLVADLDADQLDAITDVLFLAGIPTAETPMD